MTPLQLAVLEKKREVVGSLLHNLTPDQLVQAVTVKLIILEDKVGRGIRAGRVFLSCRPARLHSLSSL